MFLWKEVAYEYATICHTSAALDYKKLESRTEHEGVSFLTITLPTLGKALEASLESGVWVPDLCESFTHKGGLPLFLRGFLERVFDTSSGRLLPEPCIDSISAIRQLTLMYKKILLPVSERRTRDAMQGFMEVEEEVREWDWISSDQIERFERMVLLLWSDVLSAVDRKIYNGAIIPKHGPGVTADRLLGNKKYSQVEWPLRLERVFEYIEYALPNLDYRFEADRVTFLESDTERPVRVISVPKTLKTPRIIAIEPTCMQFMQQGVKDALVQEIESEVVEGNSRHNLGYGFVGFSNQDPNREMAREGSCEGNLATLDMSEASDRVANEHVMTLLARWPHLDEAVQATRSTKAHVLGYGEIQLSKFASMGSALTFPIEAMVFCTAVFMGIEKSLNRQITREDVLSFSGKVRVYGDDIIVPVEHVLCVMDELQALGFKVNMSKSFWNGKFRESCGGDYYDGHWVTPVYVRRVFPTSRKDVSEIESLVSLRNQLYLAGLWRSTSLLDSRIARVLPHFPIVEPSSTILGRTSFLPYRVEKVSAQTHTGLVRGYVSRYKLDNLSVDGFDALYKCLAKPTTMLEWFSIFFPEDRDPKHLERSGRGRASGMKLSWRPPF